MSDSETANTQIPAVIKKLQEILNEEKWTRASLSAYTVNQIKELDAIFDEISREKAIDEARNFCDEHLAHSKNSIGALYLSGIIGLSRQEIDDSHLMSLIGIFVDNRKWNIVEYICNRILEYGENRNALLRLAECYENEDKIEEMYETWERLVRVDLEEADIVRLIAEKKEKDGNMEAAVEYYRRALHRYVNKGLFSNAREIWTKLIELSPQDLEFFSHVQKKVARIIGEEKAASLLNDLIKYYKGIEDWDTTIQLLKNLIEYDEKNAAVRKELVEAYRAKYAGHSHIEEYIRISNLAQSYRNIHEAISDFEKHISFETGNFVFHRGAWNIGRINAIKGDEIVIDFAKKRGHVMGLKMAVASLETLEKDHIWVLKAIWSKEKLHEKVKKDIPWALKTIIKSFGNHADIKKIKAELVPSVLTASEWTSWSTKARTILRTDASFGNAPESTAIFIVRDRPLSFEEKIYNQFKAEKNFFTRIQNARDFLEVGDTSSELFSEMLAVFAGYVRSYSNVNELVISSYLFLKELSVANPSLKNMLTGSFAELISECDDIITVFNNIKDSVIKNAFLINLKKNVSGWADIYIKLFPHSLSKSLIEHLKDAGEIERLQNMVISIIENYRDHREAFIWTVKNLWEEDWVQVLGLSYDKILFTLIHILDISFKEIASHRETAENRRLNKMVDNLLFKDGRIEDFINEADLDSTERIYTLLIDVKDLDPGIKLKLRKKISELHPNFRFNDKEERTIVSRGLLVTAAKYEEKTKLLAKLIDEDVPENQKEIAFALSLGDLRENAEYKAAKEKQDELNAKITKLKNEIDRSQIYDPAVNIPGKVAFATEVSLDNETENKKEKFIILGPWESDPPNRIISYLSPLGKRMLNHKVGDSFIFAINDRKINYRITEIVPYSVE